MIKRKNDYPTSRDDISFGHIVKIVIIFAAFAIPLYIFIGKHDDNRARSHAIRALESECRTKCSSYNVSYVNLIGPTMEYGFAGRNTVNYSFVWHSNINSLIVKVRIEKESGADPTRTIIEWIPPK